MRLPVLTQSISPVGRCGPSGTLVSRRTSALHRSVTVTGPLTNEEIAVRQLGGFFCLFLRTTQDVLPNPVCGLLERRVSPRKYGRSC